jgi:hypothetical protein
VKEIGREGIQDLLRGMQGDIQTTEGTNSKDGTGLYKVLGLTEEERDELDSIMRLSEMGIGTGLVHPRVAYMSLFFLGVKWSRLEQMDAGDH